MPEYAFLMENMLSVIGISSEYMHVLPSKDSIRVNSKSFPKDNSNLYITRPWHAGDELVNNDTIQIDREALLFLFAFSWSGGAWQGGEGSLYFNGKAYSFFTNGIIGNGAVQKRAARDVMIQLENKNPSNNKPLQRWGVMWTETIGNQKRTRVKPCILNDTVPIPTY